MPRRTRPLWTLALVLYPFAAAAVAINLFMLSLMGQVVGLPVLAPAAAVGWSVPFGVPAAWLAARWVRRLIAEAEAD
ncbi:hypothetical protein CH339_08985 [Rhodobium orientis]|uniref:NnrT protein n=2 Tax=Rhodobium orientis TaxID=34017 RepID=A0A327JNG2_9HYPH|nr:hypothetical protein [Rhodobium orientis]RAI27857.1 hypothetical protein CH339_08985 [Rhodobium orientis]